MSGRALASVVFAIIVGSQPASAQGEAKLSAEKAEKAAVDAALMKPLARCWSPPPVEAPASSRVMVAFELTRRGALAGKPKVVESMSEVVVPAHAAAATGAVERCAPHASPDRSRAYWREVRVTSVLKPLPPASPSP